MKAKNDTHKHYATLHYYWPNFELITKITGLIAKITEIIKMFGGNYRSLSKIKIIILRKNVLNASMKETLASKSCFGSRHVPVTKTSTTKGSVSRRIMGQPQMRE